MERFKRRLILIGMWLLLAAVFALIAFKVFIDFFNIRFIF